MSAHTMLGAQFRDLIPVCSRLPAASVDQLVGATRVISHAGGRMGQQKLAAALHFDDEQTIGVIEFLSCLGLIDPIGSEVALTNDGRRIASSSISERRHLFADLAMRIPVIREITETLARHSARALPRSQLLNALGAQSCRMDADRVFDHVVAWGRYAGLFDYHERTGQVSLV